ncbi:uncharacterized protein N7483_004306 [Penicillium malachiteum]|uniref:uncharacterized protein n=1 Tax=Penicillium malachiteum TaxID=1324776 RepID=UPI0025497A84|nr:uncharacterized protein N7483_004306 [Penicillium malachiteum]KAJ5729798.1 hypothetical protein N7483_004306 [Penicillium malachiteum]
MEYQYRALPPLQPFLHPRPAPPSYHPGSPPRWTTMKPAEKHFRCTICQRGFTRIDHLKRHHLRHSGQKPYSCVFCNEAFARCDNLRDHYADCAQRGDRQIPETGQRGRRRHACQSCMSMKLRCDGQSPCGSCVKRNLECNNERLTRPLQLDLDEGSGSGSPSGKTEIYPEQSDRGSIKFLLNGGTDTFTEHWSLPPRGDRTRSLVFHHSQDQQDSPTEMFQYEVQQVNQPDFTPAMVDSDPAALAYCQPTFLDFFNAPYGEQKPIEDPYTGQMTYPPAGQDPCLTIPSQQDVFEPEPERPFALALIQSISSRAWILPLDPKAQEEISQCLSTLLTTARIRKFIALYFKNWQPSCPMVHLPSFDPETVPLPLLAGVVFMGAMYSHDLREVYMAKRVVDFAELFIFSTQVYSPDVEIATTFLGNRNTEEEATDWIKFQNFQAGFIIVLVQFWSGNAASRARVMETRFSEVVKLTRHLGLTKCRHLPQEHTSETMWIQMESRIRTMSIVSLLDCAFYFYQNYPYRYGIFEMELDLPCEQSLFWSDHPFSEPNFRLSRNLSLYQAFQNLFAPTPAESPGRPPEYYQMDMTIFDMFMLIHVLFAFINTQIMLIGLTKRPGSPLLSLHSPSDTTSPLPEISFLNNIRVALSRWREHWISLRNRISDDEWTAMGFYKNGYSLWLVSQLLVTNKDAVDVLMEMEVNCEDKLDKLKVLLKDEQE